MRENILRALWQQDRYAVNGWLSLPATFSAEVMAQQGWDSLTIDLQHGLQDYSTAVSLIQAMQRYPVVPLVRVPSNEPGVIGKVLDAGAWGVICPMINTVADARALVAATKYPPLGERSWGPHRATMLADMPDQKEYLRQANELIVTLAMIETRDRTTLNDVAGFLGPKANPIDEIHYLIVLSRLTAPRSLEITRKTAELPFRVAGQ